MRMLCVEQFADIGGGQRTLLDLLPEFVRRGWEPTVLVPEHGQLARAVIACGGSVETFDCRSYSSIAKPLTEKLRYARDLPRLVRSIRDIARRKQPEFIYVNGPRFLPAVACSVAQTRLPWLFHCHSRLLQRSAIVLAGLSLRLGNARVLACCKYVLEPLTPYIERQNVAVIYNGIDSYRPATSRLNRRLTRIGVVGRIEAEKGQREFVQSAKLIARQFPECRFVIAGAPLFSSSAYYDSVVSEARGLPIEFTGWQSDVKTIYSQLDILVVPSQSHEATTRVIPEAYSAGVPVVAFPSGGIPEIVQDGRTGFLCSDTTAKALAQRISEVLTMERSEIDSIVRTAQAEWERRFTLDKYKDQVCRVITSAVPGSV